METQELLDSVHETFRNIEKRLAALETVHTRYSGPKGPRGDKGDPGPQGPAGKDGRDGRDGVDGVSNVAGSATQKLAREWSNFVHYRLIVDTDVERCPSCGRLLIRKPD